MTDPIGPNRGPQPIKAGVTAEPRPVAAAAALPPLAKVKIPEATVEAAGKPGTFSYTTTMKMAAPPQKVLDALQGDWNVWWKGGQQSNLVKHADGSASFDLAPVHAPPAPDLIKVHVEVAAPRAEKVGDGYKVVLPVTLSGSFNGQAGFTITQAPDGSTNVQSTWTDVAPHGTAKAMGGKALDAHFRAENNALRNLNNHLNGKPMHGLTGLLSNPLPVKRL
ncbi:MAG: hypothetical protein JWM80_1951 [Cyanobacteria bacterium RYN_339]|nr:hypothetical protein [Cyanobacteria bacterium RYN_339]